MQYINDILASLLLVLLTVLRLERNGTHNRVVNLIAKDEMALGFKKKLIESMQPYYYIVFVHMRVCFICIYKSFSKAYGA